MKVTFDKLPLEARVWMYQTNSFITSEMESRINRFGDEFLMNWESHGIPVEGSIDVLKGHFIRIAAFTDEPSMCGRAQDAQVNLVKQLEVDLHIQLTDRLLLAFQGPEELNFVDMSNVADGINSGSIKAETVFYNNLVGSKEEFVATWQVSASSSWLDRFF